MSEQFFYTGNLRNNTFDIDQIPNETNVSVYSTDNSSVLFDLVGFEIARL